MKKLLAVALLSATAASSAFAGVAEKKAMRHADEMLAAEVQKIQTACGNEALSIEVSWDEVKDSIAANADLLKDKRMDGKAVINEMANRTVSTLESLAKICADDADYKEEIANLTNIVIKAKDDFSDYKSEFTLEGTTLTTLNGHYMTRSRDDFTNRLKALY